MGIEPYAAARLRLVVATTRDPLLRAELAALVAAPPADPHAERADADGERCPRCAGVHPIDAAAAGDSSGPERALPPARDGRTPAFLRRGVPY